MYDLLLYGPGAEINPVSRLSGHRGGGGVWVSAVPRSRVLTAPRGRLVGAEASASPVGVIDRHTLIHQEEGETISDSLITTGTKMTRTPRLKR